jgi:predicted DNA binding protein
LFEVTFKAKHDCPYVRFSAKYPDVKIAQWCNRKVDVLEVECGDIETFNRIGPSLRGLVLWKGGRVLSESFGDRNIQVITKTCRDFHLAPSISSVVEKHSFLSIQPVVYGDGWETHKTIGFREADFKNLFRALEKLGPVEVLSKRVYPEKSLIDTFAVSLSSIFKELTMKQVDAMVAALELGYYHVPKKISTEQLALKHKIPRTTFEEHLRKAEGKTLRGLAPFLLLYAQRPVGVQKATAEIVAR